MRFFQLENILGSIDWDIVISNYMQICQKTFLRQGILITNSRFLVFIHCKSIFTRLNLRHDVFQVISIFRKRFPRHDVVQLHANISQNNFLVLHLNFNILKSFFQFPINILHGIFVRHKGFQFYANIRDVFYANIRYVFWMLKAWRQLIFIVRSMKCKERWNGKKIGESL